MNISRAKPKRNRRNLTPILVLLLNTGLMWFGFFMLVPLLAVHITRDLLLGAGMAGLVLAIRQFIQQGLGPFAGPIADWAGYSKMMMLGNLVRALGFGWIAVATEPLGLMLGGVVAALGGACFEASGKASLAYYSKGYNRESVFSLSITVGNVGMALGPLVGSMLLKFNFMVVGMVSGGIYVLCFLLILLFVPEIERAEKAQKSVRPGDIFGKLGLVWRNRPFVLVHVLLIGYYFLYVQINICLPLIAVELTGSEDSVSLIFAINSGMAILLQFFSIKLISKWMKPISAIGIGIAFSTVGLFAITFVSNYALLLFCVAIYAFGRLLVDPMAFTLTSRYATEDTLASFFGFSSLALAFGGMAGNLLGGWLYDTGKANGFPVLCWVVFGAVGGLVIIGVIAFKFWEEHYLTSGKVAPQNEILAPSPENE
ncbi:MFS transporter [Candidatus Chlorohelix sp.]|uniref:MDR family MFS transporter n=1 Tax=Candidatus Chlorohelix sp. TaxID=3139201 RepID=UPI00303A8223